MLPWGRHAPAAEKAVAEGGRSRGRGSGGEGAGVSLGCGGRELQVAVGEVAALAHHPAEWLLRIQLPGELLARCHRGGKCFARRPGADFVGGGGEVLVAPPAAGVLAEQEARSR